MVGLGPAPPLGCLMGPTFPKPSLSESFRGCVGPECVYGSTMEPACDRWMEKALGSPPTVEPGQTTGIGAERRPRLCSIPRDTQRQGGLESG